MNYLLDTCVISDFFKKIPSVIKKFQELSPKQIHLSSISVMEIEFGLFLNPLKDVKIRPHWNQMKQLVTIIPYSPQCAEQSARIRASLQTSGALIGPYDLLIAGTALANNMVIVTSNFSEFKRITDIQIENWR